MGFLRRLAHDLKAGWASLRAGTAQAATRALEETELLRLRLELRKLDDRLTELCRGIGERAVELHERGMPAERVLADHDVLHGAEQVKALRAERDKILRDMDEIRSGR